MLADASLAKDMIAKRVSKELNDGDLVNLGIGLPTLVANHISEDINVIFHSENGMAGIGSDRVEPDRNVVDAGGKPSSLITGGQFFDSATSFALIRGGHVDVCVLGALEVDKYGNLANWIIPGKLVPGMGGAMDLVVGAKKVIVAMVHTAKGRSKILDKCRLPLTAEGKVKLIVTEYGVMEPTEDGLLLKEMFSHTDLDEIQSITETKLKVADDLKIIQ